MAYWIFKVSALGNYPDTPGQTYVYDNTHSVRVRTGDEFIYLEKAGAKYGLTGAGRVAKVTSRSASSTERHNDRVDRVFTAHVSDMVWFTKPFSLSSRSSEGRQNRRLSKLPEDLNGFGWSISMPTVDHDLFVRLLDAAMDNAPHSIDGANADEWRVDDSWSVVRQRLRMHVFRAAVIKRHSYSCFVCGTTLRSVLEAAHLCGYAGHPEHRANPANGICMCSYCHSAFDAGEITLHPGGEVKVKVAEGECDPIAQFHFTRLRSIDRHSWLAGIDWSLLVSRL